MSELIEDLKQSNETAYREELAKTYFSTTPSTQDHFTQSAAPAQDKKTRIRLSGIIASLLAMSLIALIFMFIAAKKIEIDVKVVPAQSNPFENGEVVYLDKNGEPNRDIINDAIFYDDADARSGWGKEYVTLANENGSKKATMSVRFNAPIDMSGESFCFLAKGKNGDEELMISLKDSKNNYCDSAVNTVQNEWTRFIIDAKQAGDFVDIANIAYIGFELNPKEKQFPNRSAVYLKEICIIKKGGEAQ